MDPRAVLAADGAVEGLDQRDVVEDEVDDFWDWVRGRHRGEELRVPDAAAAGGDGEVVEEKGLHQ